MAKITKQDVWRVATEIDAGGDKPSVLEVRKRLGAGSYTTITAALREWIKPDSEEQEEIDPMPAVVSEKIDQFGADLYALILRIAHEQFDQKRKEWETERKVIEAERDEAAKLSELAESSADAAIVQVEELRGLYAQAVADAKLWEMRVGDLIMDKERAMLDAATARDELGNMRGRVEALERIVDGQKLGKPVSKETKPKFVKPPLRIPGSSGPSGSDQGGLPV